MPLTVTVEDLSGAGMPGSKSFGQVRAALSGYFAAQPNDRRSRLLKLEKLAGSWWRGHRDRSDARTVAGLQIVRRLLDEIPAETKTLINLSVASKWTSAVDAGVDATRPHVPGALRALTRDGKAVIRAALTKAAEDEKAQWGLTDAEVQAIRLYSVLDYGYINAGVAKDVATIKFIKGLADSSIANLSMAQIIDEANAWTAVAANAAAKLPRTWATTYRGLRCSMDTFKAQFFDPTSPAVPLKQWEAGSLTSTSLLRLIGLQYAHALSVNTIDPSRELAVLMQFINVGSSVLGHLSRYPHEEEVLILPRSRFTIQSVEQVQPDAEWNTAQVMAAQHPAPKLRYLVTLTNDSPEVATKPQTPLRPAGSWKAAKPGAST